jgi:hypothetical protein
MDWDLLALLPSLSSKDVLLDTAAYTSLFLFLMKVLTPEAFGVLELFFTRLYKLKTHIRTLREQFERAPGSGVQPVPADIQVRE